MGDKLLLDGLRVDPLRELRANKLGALLGRGDIKDLVDLFVLAEAGLDPIDGLQDAAAKDAGMEPATLAWVLQQVSTDPSALLLERQLSQAELEAFRDQLVQRLQALAWPRR